MKHKNTAILLAFIFAPLGFLYTWKQTKYEFLFTLVTLTTLLIIVDYFYFFIYLVIHFIILFRFFISENNSFYSNYPIEDYNLQDL